MAQSVEHLTLDCASGRDLTVREIEPRVGLCTDGMEPAWDSLFLPLPLSPAHALSLSKRKIKKLSKIITEPREILKHGSILN